jgi:hypothetical protein
MSCYQPAGRAARVFTSGRLLRIMIDEAMAMGFAVKRRRSTGG